MKASELWKPPLPLLTAPLFIIFAYGLLDLMVWVMEACSFGPESGEMLGSRGGRLVFSIFISGMLFVLGWFARLTQQPPPGTSESTSLPPAKEN